VEQVILFLPVLLEQKFGLLAPVDKTVEREVMLEPYVINHGQFLVEIQYHILLVRDLYIVEHILVVEVHRLLLVE
jgi:hypothetical protein